MPRTFRLRLWHVLSVAGMLLVASASTVEPLPLFCEQPYRAVILPADPTNTRNLPIRRYHSFWTPAPEEVRKAEKRIREFIAAAPDDASLTPYQRRLRVQIRDHPETFVRQYFGAMWRGRKLIVCNAIPLKFRQVFGRDWRESYFRLSDAPGFWQLEYEIENDRCDRFHVEEGY